MPPTARSDPSPSFQFHVEIAGLNVARFSECGGLDFEQETFDYPEGGVNSHVHRFPGRFKFSNITLKKGVALDGQTIWDWIQSVVKAANTGQVPTKTVTVTLFDLTGRTPLRTWNFQAAYPIKWSLVALSAEQNAIAIETLTLAHQGQDFSQ
jgi:phage tail-like protein